VRSGLARFCEAWLVSAGLGEVRSGVVRHGVGFCLRHARLCGSVK